MAQNGLHGRANIYSVLVGLLVCVSPLAEPIKKDEQRDDVEEVEPGERPRVLAVGVPRRGVQSGDGSPVSTRARRACEHARHYNSHRPHHNPTHCKTPRSMQDTASLPKVQRLSVHRHKLSHLELGDGLLDRLWHRHVEAGEEVVKVPVGHAVEHRVSLLLLSVARATHAVSGGLTSQGGQTSWPQSCSRHPHRIRHSG
jgi:hypothetical protein